MTRSVTLAAALFVYLVAELVPVGLLPEMAADLHVPPGRVASLVGWYAAVAAVCGLPASALARRWPRRRVLVASMALLSASQVVVAVAPTLEVVAAARGASAVAHVVVWATVPLVAAEGASRDQVGRAVGRVFYGTSAATVLGVPAATWAGQLLGWRVVPALLALGAAAVALALTRLLPDDPSPRSAGHPERASGSRRAATGPVVATIAATLLAVLAAYTVYPFLSLVAERAGLDGTTYAWLLAAFGVAGIVGVRVASVGLDRRPNLAPATVVVAATTLPLLTLVPGALPTAAAIPLWGAPMAALPVVLQGTLVRLTGPGGDLASGAYVVAYQVGIAAGTWLGGVVGGERAWTAALLGLATVPVVLVASRSGARAEQDPGLRPASGRSAPARSRSSGS